MKIEHAALYTEDLEKMRSFFMKYFEASSNELYHNPKTGFIHLAFSAGAKEKVDLLTEALSKDGYEVLSGPRTTGDGYYESLILGPERIQIEITE